MDATTRTVLITGCSDGGMGAALAKELHQAGLRVFATARDMSKMKSLKNIPGIHTLELDIASEGSIQTCVQKVDRLDILINNAGAQYTMPISDLNLSEAKHLFDSNLWGHIAMTQACLPLLLRKSSNKAIVAYPTSVGAGQAMPYQGTYNASKAALSMFADTLRMELKPFEISVVELRTAGVRTNVVKNLRAMRTPKLPQDSIYAPARAAVEEALSLSWAEGIGIPADQWARGVVADLLRKKNVPRQIWRGESAWLAWFAGVLPTGVMDGMVMRMTRIDEIGHVFRKK